jgi:hypothetical protein
MRRHDVRGLFVTRSRACGHLDGLMMTRCRRSAAYGCSRCKLWCNGGAKLDRAGRYIAERSPAMDVLAHRSALWCPVTTRNPAVRPGVWPCSVRGCGCAHKRERPRRGRARTSRTSPQKRQAQKLTQGAEMRSDQFGAGTDVKE